MLCQGPPSGVSDETRSNPHHTYAELASAATDLPGEEAGLTGPRDCYRSDVIAEERVAWPRVRVTAHSTGGANPRVNGHRSSYPFPTEMLRASNAARRSDFQTHSRNSVLLNAAAFVEARVHDFKRCRLAIR